MHYIKRHKPCTHYWSLLSAGSSLAARGAWSLELGANSKQTTEASGHIDFTTDRHQFINEVKRGVLFPVFPKVWMAVLVGYGKDQDRSLINGVNNFIWEAIGQAPATVP